MNNDERQAEYERLCHAMQAGVAMEMNYKPEPTTPKHLRVGINNALVIHSALVRLLVSKGVITHEEYGDAIIAEMKMEVERYEGWITEHMGGNTKITLA